MPPEMRRGPRRINRSHLRTHNQPPPRSRSQPVYRRNASQAFCQLPCLESLSAVAATA